MEVTTLGFFNTDHLPSCIDLLDLTITSSYILNTKRVYTGLCSPNLLEKRTRSSLRLLKYLSVKLEIKIGSRSVELKPFFEVVVSLVFDDMVWVCSCVVAEVRASSI